MNPYQSSSFNPRLAAIEAARVCAYDPANRKYPESDEAGERQPAEPNQAES
jgi:hypothetical protein